MTTAKIMRVEEAFWELPPGHFQAFSKLLVHPTNAATKYFDFRISSYQPRGYAEVHVHEVAENLYYILRGKGIVELDGVRHLVEPHMVIHIPPGGSPRHLQHGPGGSRVPGGRLAAGRYAGRGADPRGMMRYHPPPAFPPRGPGGGLISALCAPRALTSGPRRLTLLPPGRDLGSLQGGRGERLVAAKGLWELSESTCPGTWWRRGP